MLVCRFEACLNALTRPVLALASFVRARLLSSGSGELPDVLLSVRLCLGISCHRIKTSLPKSITSLVSTLHRFQLIEGSSQGRSQSKEDSLAAIACEDIVYRFPTLLSSECPVCQILLQRAQASAASPQWLSKVQRRISESGPAPSAALTLSTRYCHKMAKWTIRLMRPAYIALHL